MRAFDKLGDSAVTPIFSCKSFALVMCFDAMLNAHVCSPICMDSLCAHSMMSDFEVYIPDESSMHDFLVAFPGPEDSEFPERTHVLPTSGSGTLG